MEQKTKSGFSLYVNSNENIQNALFLREKRKKYRMGLIIAFVVVCICTIFAYRYRTYHRMKVVKTITKELTESFQSFAYKKGTICYSEDGISFLDGKGNEKWNKTYSIKNPQASYCGDYIVVASKNGNEIALLDSDGQMKKFSVSYPIVDLEVAKQGVIALILVVDGINVKSRVALYNFGQEGEDSGDQMIGGFDFKDTVIPKVSFMGDSKAVAIGDDQMIFFKVGKTISKKQTISFDKDVSSVAVNDDYAAFVFEDQKKTDQEKYEAVVYNKTGKKLMSHKFSSEYNKLLLGEKEILLAGNYHCSIVNFAGHEMFKKDFKKRIVNISPTGKRQKYLITYENSTNLSEIY